MVAFSIGLFLVILFSFIGYKIGFYLGKIRGWGSRGELEKAKRQRYVSEWEAGKFLER